MILRNVGYNDVRFPLLVAMRLYSDFVSVICDIHTVIMKSA